MASSREAGPKTDHGGEISQLFFLKWYKNCYIVSGKENFSTEDIGIFIPFT
jgi:hypothetical protein